MENVIQKGYLNDISRGPFRNIFEDFLSDVKFKDSNVVDLGPGQYDFSVLARERGASGWGLDKDPAVLALGAYKGFTVRDVNLHHLHKEKFDIKFDGLFCKFSWNAFWHRNDDETHIEAVEYLGKMITDDAWIWVAPWNGVPVADNLSEDRVKEIADLQSKLFSELGCQQHDLTEEEKRRYGVTYTTVANHVVFTRNLTRK